MVEAGQEEESSRLMIRTKKQQRLTALPRPLPVKLAGALTLKIKMKLSKCSCTRGNLLKMEQPLNSAMQHGTVTVKQPVG